METSILVNSKTQLKLIFSSQGKKQFLIKTEAARSFVGSMTMIKVFISEPTHPDESGPSVFISPDSERRNMFERGHHCCSEQSTFLIAHTWAALLLLYLRIS